MITQRPFRTGGWEVDIWIRFPDGRRIRVRKKAPVSSKSGALRWGQALEQELLANGLIKKPREVPTLAEFAPRFLEGYAVANRQKPSTIVAKETILRVHLVPQLGTRPLDAITNEDVQHLKRRLAERSPKTVNNVLTVLGTMLRVALDWEVIEHLPCRVRLVKTPRTHAAFHDFDEYARLVAAARKLGHLHHVVVLLGGDAGLRCGEIIALEWTDVDFSKRQLRIQRSDWRGQVTATKGNRPRAIPMTDRLASALRAHRHLRGPRVACHDDGRPLTQGSVQDIVARGARMANLPNRGVHVLRHTFCSHLAMKGAPVRAIQELAVHADLSTTQRYMHLSPAAVERAIRLLDDGPLALQQNGNTA